MQPRPERLTVRLDGRFRQPARLARSSGQHRSPCQRRRVATDLLQPGDPLLQASKLLAEQMFSVLNRFITDIHGIQYDCPTGIIGTNSKLESAAALGHYQEPARPRRANANRRARAGRCPAPRVPADE